MKKLLLVLSTLLSLAITTDIYAVDTYPFAVVRSAGLVELNKDALYENHTFKIVVPANIICHERSTVTALLPNKCGLYVGYGSTLTIRQIATDFLAGTKSSAINFTWLEFDKDGGVMAYCSPDSADRMERVQQQVKKLKLVAGGGVTYAILDNKLYVTRGVVQVGENNDKSEVKPVNVGIDQCLELVLPLKVVPIKDDEALKRVILEVTVEACSARLSDVPAAAADSTGDNKTSTPFPMQPLIPDVVSPSS